MKVSDIIIYIMKIMWSDLKNIVWVVSEIYKKALKVQSFSQNETYRIFYLLRRFFAKHQTLSS